VSTQPISDDALAKAEKLLSTGHHAACSTRIPGGHCDCYVSTKLEYVLAAALVAVRAERDRLILAIRSHAPKQADAIIDVAAVSSPGEDGLVLRCSLAAIHSPHCWAMYGDDDSPWYRCPGEETP
jgi:hypothetical protein